MVHANLAVLFWFSTIVFNVVFYVVDVIFTLILETNMKHQLIKFLQDEEGATAIEYGLIAGIIAVALLASLTSVRDALVTIFNNIAAALT